jgi:predicted ATPase
MALVNNRFGKDGLYILDEPEAALSPMRQLALLTNIHQLIKEGCQFIIATHSPILLAYPEATIYKFSEQGLQKIRYEESEHYVLTRDFLNHRDMYLNKLFEP